jgi:hypothetical protein
MIDGNKSVTRESHLVPRYFNIFLVEKARGRTEDEFLMFSTDIGESFSLSNVGRKHQELILSTATSFFNKKDVEVSGNKE